ncbi:diacylglycerol/lipid kinase family protein [Pseudactinotalea sp. Z1732]|uniref:diacylglycerol/lipid kinase family protein n=1 Tax=Micrococcales TaxID=85006 RepID=UPI003C7C7D09
MTTVGVVINPTAGNGRAQGRGLEVMAALRANGVRTVDLSGQDAEHALALARAALDTLDALVVVGGDGMAHLGVNAIAGTGVALGLVPAGSGNDLARALGVPVGDVPGAVRMILQAVAEGPRYIDAIATNSTVAPARVPRWTACVLSAGLDAAVNARANTYRWPGGAARYLRGVVAELATFTPYHYRITIDGQVRTQSATLVALANGPTFGGGLKIAPNAEFDDGLMEVVIADALNRRQILRIFPRLYNGTHLSHPAVHVMRAREVTLEPGGEVPPPRAFGDGEDLFALPLTAKVLPRAVPLLAPSPESSPRRPAHRR